MTLDALEEIANVLGFVLYTRAYVRSIGLDAEFVPIATGHGMCRLGSDPKIHATPIEFEGTPRECAAFLIGWRDRGAQTKAGAS